MRVLLPNRQQKELRPKLKSIYEALDLEPLPGGIKKRVA